jgi:hypothetical protein
MYSKAPLVNTEDGALVGSDDIFFSPNVSALSNVKSSRNSPTPWIFYDIRGEVYNIKVNDLTYGLV